MDTCISMALSLELTSSEDWQDCQELDGGDPAVLDGASRSQTRWTHQPVEDTASSKPANDGSNDEVDNREFARQLASIKQGTNLNATKRADEKRQKPVKQSRAGTVFLLSFIYPPTDVQGLARQGRRKDQEIFG
ncbi:hypothetical protein QBC41DRAFT_350714 [Cercophora samala]|uniref:Uncharacterized protein n=1 Tax=Cercophora samala TaxID=330535 RepID=A0AA39YZ38_9PEZI|nr:hypothetical protein QBC41DRAFT_350714 [Cercophora samala]